MMKFTKPVRALTALSLFTPIAFAQDKPADPRPAHAHVAYDKTLDCRTLPTRTETNDCAMQNQAMRIFRLENVTQQNDANEILVALRNSFDPSTKMFLIAAQNAIIVISYPADIARMAEIVRELDRPHPSFRITYTFTDADSGDKTFPQASVVANAGQNVVLKRGDKIPIMTESAKVDATTQTYPVASYVDVGLLIDTTVSGPVSRGVSIKYRLDESSLADAKSEIGPTIHQTTLNGVTTIPIGKTTAIGTIELPGTKHRVVISAMAEEVQ